MAGVRILRERWRHVFRVAAGYAVVGWLLRPEGATHG